MKDSSQLLPLLSHTFMPITIYCAWEICVKIALNEGRQKAKAKKDGGIYGNPAHVCHVAAACRAAESESIRLSQPNCRHRRLLPRASKLLANHSVSRQLPDY
uniref:Uncharacterized protein n=1 Tax=Plectus sambesii TaxID=2011161 RepID=A0A914UV85_9BILA